MLLPVGTTLEFQMHYTPIGRPAGDATNMRIWVLDETPKHEVFSLSASNCQIKIPVHARNHKETIAREIPKDAWLYSMLPHAHFRGKVMEIGVVYPDGEYELLLSVPNYDFNWQTSFTLSEPKLIPAGSKLIQYNWWDNSGQNGANPNPNIEVRWGQQSFEVMLFGAFMMRYLNEDEIAAVRADQTQNVSSLD